MTGKTYVDKIIVDIETNPQFKDKELNTIQIKNFSQHLVEESRFIYGQCARIREANNFQIEIAYVKITGENKIEHIEVSYTLNNSESKTATMPIDEFYSFLIPKEKK